jgi:apolipoprotein D and lipocalin family protein
MKNKLTSILIVLIIFGIKAFPQPDNSDNKNNVKTVSFVNLKKYAGKWYEIAKIPNRFQKGCVRNTTAEYKLRDDSDIDVINRCIEADGSVNEAEGLAKVVDEKSNSKLEVSFVSIFGIHLFWGDYWIIGLDKNYEYAVIGHPERKYGWILNRSPKMSEEKLKEAFEILKENGYDPKDFVTTIQR